MNYTNIKVDFEYLGTDYSGFALEEGVDYEAIQSQKDGFDAILMFNYTNTVYPRVFIAGMSCIYTDTSPASGCYLIAKAP